MSEKFKQVMCTFTIINKHKSAYNSNKSIYFFYLIIIFSVVKCAFKGL